MDSVEHQLFGVFAGCKTYFIVAPPRPRDQRGEILRMDERRSINREEDVEEQKGRVGSQGIERGEFELRERLKGEDIIEEPPPPYEPVAIDEWNEMVEVYSICSFWTQMRSSDSSVEAERKKQAVREQQENEANRLRLARERAAIEAERQRNAREKDAAEAARQRAAMERAAAESARQQAAMERASAEAVRQQAAMEAVRQQAAMEAVRQRAAKENAAMEEKIRMMNQQGELFCIELFICVFATLVLDSNSCFPSGDSTSRDLANEAAFQQSREPSE